MLAGGAPARGPMSVGVGITQACPGFSFLFCPGGPGEGTPALPKSPSHCPCPLPGLTLSKPLGRSLVPYQENHVSS